MYTGEPANKGPVLKKHGPFCLLSFPLWRTRSEDSADRIGRKSSTHVLRQESEGEVTQGETEGFDRSDRVLLGEPFRLPLPLFCSESTFSPETRPSLSFIVLYLTVDVKR